MCIAQTFPDVIVQDHDKLRLVTHAARRWMYENIEIKKELVISGPDQVPKIVIVSFDARREMQADGLVVRQQKCAHRTYG